MSLDSVKEKENHFKSSHSEECIVEELDCEAVEMVGGAGKGDGSTDWELSATSPLEAGPIEPAVREPAEVNDSP